MIENKYGGGTLYQMRLLRRNSFIIIIIIVVVVIEVVGLWCISYLKNRDFSAFENNTGQMDGPTDGRTHNLL